MKYTRLLLLVFSAICICISCDPRDVMDPPNFCDFTILNDSENTIIFREYYTWAQEDGYAEQVKIEPGQSYLQSVRVNADKSSVFDTVWTLYLYKNAPYAAFIVLSPDSDDIYLKEYKYDNHADPDSFFNEENWEKQDWPDEENRHYHHYKWSFSIKDNIIIE